MNEDYITYEELYAQAEASSRLDQHNTAEVFIRSAKTIEKLGKDLDRLIKHQELQEEEQLVYLNPEVDRIMDEYDND